MKGKNHVLLVIFLLFAISCGSEIKFGNPHDKNSEAYEPDEKNSDSDILDDPATDSDDNIPDSGDPASGDADLSDTDDPGHSDSDISSDPSEEPDEPIFGDCTPGKQQLCGYQGPEGTEGVGPCQAAKRTCREDGTWGYCEGGYVPVSEIGELCSDGIDNDCNGVVDDGTDFDGDGFGACTDCCEFSVDCMGFDPVDVYPGAYEMIGDGIDNNCNGEFDEATSCDGEDGELVVGDYPGNAVKLAHAMGICGDQLVSAEISLAGEPVTEKINGSDRQSLPLPYYDENYQTFAAEPKFGNNIVPKEGLKIAILSTGPWNKPTRDANSATLATGDMRTASKIPSDWINMMPNCTIPKSPTCGGTVVQDGLTNQCEGKEIPSVQDPIMLTLEVKVPMNAHAFEFNLFFFSIEYPSNVCANSNYNDFFIALLDSEHNTTYPNDEFQNPYDKNLAKDYNGNFVGVDLAPEGLFQVCGSNGNYASNCIQGTTLLEGTGFDTFNSGGTGWLTTRGNVVPGETIKLRLALWEQGIVGYGPDHSWDSTVLLDGFKWLPLPVRTGTAGNI